MNQVRRAVFVMLGAVAATAAIAATPQIVLEPVDRASRLAEDSAVSGAAPLRYAESRAVRVTPATAGHWQRNTKTQRWVLDVTVPGATDLNFGFAAFRLPQGAALYIKSPAHDYTLRPFTAADNETHGQLWTPPVPGSHATIELELPAGARDYALELNHIGAGYRDLFGLDGPANLTRAGTCNTEVACPQAVAWNDEIRSVAAYSFGGSIQCTGELIMDEPGSFTPYFLTARHCGVNANNAASVVVFWNFESPACGDFGGGSFDDFQTGAIWRAGRVDVDFTLLELDDVPDPGFDVFYGGWDRSGDAPDAATGIHHPGGDEKAISFADGPVLSGLSCADKTATGQTHWYLGFDEGITQPGSSGSALWRSSGPDPYVPNSKKIVGVLTASASNCDAQGATECYGKLSVAWDGDGPGDRLRDWLDPNDTGAIAVNGADPDFPAVCGDSALQPGEICDDGNAAGGDGCSADCQLETGWNCTPPDGGPGVCLRDCFYEDFDSAGSDLSALGWTVFNSGVLDVDWGTTNDGVCGAVSGQAGNFTGGSGEAACIDSGATAGGEIDAYLCSPAIDLSAASLTELEFSYSYQVLFQAGEDDFFEVLAGMREPDNKSVRSYQTLFATSDNAGVLNGIPGVDVSLSLASFEGAPGAHVCFRYGGNLDWYAQVDDVSVRGACLEAVSDADGDGVPDAVDNCPVVANAAPANCDTDGDGIGNRCDADIDQAGSVVGFSDLAAFVDAFQNQDNAEADLDCNGIVNFADLLLFKLRFGTQPGDADIQPAS